MDHRSHECGAVDPNDWGMLEMPTEGTGRLAVAQAGAVPFRLSRVASASGGAARRTGSGVQVMLITNRRGEWGIPKGLVERGWTAEQTALNEAQEEAGVSGSLIGESLGAYRYEKDGRAFEVRVWGMLVTTVHTAWRERHRRQRRWVSVEQAIGLLHRDDVAALVGLVAGLGEKLASATPMAKPGAA